MNVHSVMEKKMEMEHKYEYDTETEQELKLGHCGRTFVVGLSDTSEADHVFTWIARKLMRPDDTLKMVFAQKFSGKRIHTDVVPLVQSESSLRLSRSLNADMLSDRSFTLSRRYSKLCEDLGIKNYSVEAVLEDIGVGRALCEYIEKLELLPGVNSDNIVLVLGQKRVPAPSGIFSKPENVVHYCVKHSPCPVIVVKERFIPKIDREKHIVTRITNLKPKHTTMPQPMVEESKEFDEDVYLEDAMAKGMHLGDPDSMSADLERR